MSATVLAADKSSLIPSERQPDGLPAAASDRMQKRNDGTVARQNTLAELTQNGPAPAARHNEQGLVSEMQWTDGTILTFSYTYGGPGGGAGTIARGTDSVSSIKIAAADGGGIIVVSPPRNPPLNSDIGRQDFENEEARTTPRLSNADLAIHAHLSRKAFDEFVSSLDKRSKNETVNFKRLAALLSDYRKDQDGAITTYIQKTKSYYDTLETNLKTKLGVELSAAPDAVIKIQTLDAAAELLRTGQLKPAGPVSESSMADVIALEKTLHDQIVVPGARALREQMSTNAAAFQHDAAILLSGAVTSVQESGGTVEIVIVLP